ncbi:MAG TPA: alpha/beta hydrolase [Burkholderiales bacterium]|nr:alpha/beta hydrolase [Burkholderiales bacterium]
MSDVVLAGGLWMPVMGMALLGARLGRQGFSTHVFDYSGRDSLEGNVERLVRHARDHGRAHFVGHSLGGVLIFDMLNRHPEVDAASVVLLGAPVRGCLAGRRLAVSTFGRWMMGATAPRWGERDATWVRPEPLGIIAGTLPIGLGWMTGRLPGRSDGVVRVEETVVHGMAQQVMVPLGHSFLLASAQVAGLVERFFATRRFA